MNARSSNRRVGALPSGIPAPDENTLRRWVRLHAAAIVWTALATPVALLGLWGFLEIQVPVPSGPPQRLTPLDACYRTLRLFTLSMDLPPDAKPPLQLWIAAFAAQGHVSKWRNRIFVVDSDPQWLATMAELGAWTVRGDGISRVSLRRSAVRRAASTVIVTGNDEQNTAIMRRLYGLRLQQEPEIYV